MDHSSRVPRVVAVSSNISSPGPGLPPPPPRAPGPLRSPKASTPYPGLGHRQHHALAQARAMAGGWAPAQDTGRKAERSVRPGKRPGDGDAVCEREVCAPGAGQAGACGSERTSEPAGSGRLSDGRGGAGGAGWGALGTTQGSRGFWTGAGFLV